MLDTITGLTSTITTEAVVSAPLSGRYLAHNPYPAYQRAFFAADLLLERAHLSKPTVKQAAAVCGVTVPYTAAARRIAYCRPDLRAAVEHGLRPLIKTAWPQPSPSDELVSAWDAASNSERIEFARRVGINTVWEEAISPAIG